MPITLRLLPDAEPMGQPKTFTLQNRELAYFIKKPTLRYVTVAMEVDSTGQDHPLHMCPSKARVWSPVTHSFDKNSIPCIFPTQGSPAFFPPKGPHYMLHVASIAKVTTHSTSQALPWKDLTVPRSRTQKSVSRCISLGLEVLEKPSNQDKPLLTTH